MFVIPKNHKKTRQAEAAKAQMEAAGVDPATIEMILSLILAGMPGIFAMIAKLFKFKA